MWYRAKLWIFFHIVAILVLILGCNYNPLGGNNSHVEQGNAPFLSTPAPFLINGILATSNVVYLTWNTSLKADDYTVVYGTSSGNYTNTAANCAAFQGNSCTISNLVNGTPYYFNVIARNLFGTTQASNEVTVTPNIFTIIVKPSSGTALIVWPDIGGGLASTNYTLQYGTSPTTISNSISGISSPYLLTGLTDGLTYYFQIIASSPAGTALSNIVSALVISPPQAPTFVGTPGVASSGITLNWNAATGSGTIRYTLYHSANQTGPFDSIPTCANLSVLTCLDPRSNLIGGQVYYYYVIATNEGGNSPQSSPASALSYPSVPGGLSVTAATSASNMLSWQPSLGNGNVTYTIYRSTLTPVSLAAGNIVGSVTSTPTTPLFNYTDSSSFIENTNYYYTVTASNLSGTSVNSDTVNIISALSTVPSSLNASSISSNGLSLGWTFAPAGSAPVTFNVYRSNSAITTWNDPVCSNCSNPFVDSGLSENTNYYYMVEAINQRPNAVSVQSITYSATTALFYAPQLYSASTLSSSSISLNWTAVNGNGTVTYDVYRSTSGNTGTFTTKINTLPLTSTSLTDTGLSENTTYWYIIKANNYTPANILVSTLSSSSISATTFINTASTITTTATTVTSNSMTFSWSAALNNTAGVYYAIFRSTDGVSYTQINNSIITTTSYTDSGLTENSNYYYKVYSYNGVKGQPLIISAAQMFTTQIVTAPTLVIDSVSTNSVNLQWNKSIGNASVSYNVYRSLASNVSSSSTVICTNLVSSVNSCLDTNSVSASQTYYYIVTAKNSVNTVVSLSISVVTLPNIPSVPTVTAVDGNVTIIWPQSASPGNASLIKYVVSRSRTIGGIYTTVSNCDNISDNNGGICIDSGVAVDGFPYYYTVSASTQVGQVVTPSTAVSITPIIPISNISTLISGTTATITWTGGTTAAVGTTINVYYSQTQGAPVSGKSVACSNVTTTCSFTGVLGNNYYFTMQANNNLTGIAKTTSYEFLGVFHPVTDLITATAGTGRVTLSWLPVVNATSYSIYFGTSPNPFSTGSVGCTVSPINPDPTTYSCIISGLTNGTQYYFDIFITKSVGGNFIGTDVTATPIGSFDFSVSPVDTQSATLSLIPPLGAVTLNIAYGSSSNNYTTKTITIPATTTFPYTITGLSAGATYYFMVTALSAASSVNANSEQLLVMYIGAPTGLAVSNITSSSMLLSWNIITGNPTATYNLYSSTQDNLTACDTNTSLVPICSVLSTASPNSSCAVNSLLENTNYYYVAAAANANGKLSTCSASKMAVTQLATVPTLSAANVTSNSIDINWPQSSGNGTVNYSLYYATSLPLGSSSFTNLNISPTVQYSYSHKNLSENTIYYYYLSASNLSPSTVTTANNSLAFSATTDIVTPPTLAATVGSHSTINLSWVRSALWGAGAVNYSLYRSLTGADGSWTSAITTITNSTSSPVTYQDTGLSENTIYFYKLVSNNGNKANLTSFTSATTQLNTSPTFSTLNTSTDVTESTIKLSWNPPASWGSNLSNIKYTLYYAEGNAAPYTWNIVNTTPTAATTLTVNTLTQNTIYSFQVRATNDNINYVSSTPLSVTTDLSLTPTFNLTFGTVTANSVVLNWAPNPAPGVGGSTVTYNVYRSTTGAVNTWLPVSNCTNTNIYTCTDLAGLIENTQYFYKVTANNGGATTLVATNNVTTLLATVPILNLSSISPVTATSATLTWSAANGNQTVTYKVYRSTSLPVSTAGAFIHTTTDPSQNTYTDSALTAGSNYYYVVTINNSKNTLTSLPLSIVTLPAQANTPNVSAVGGAVAITWNQNTGTAAFSYLVQRSTTIGTGYETVGTCASVSGTGSTLTCSDVVTVVDGVTTYYYTITAMANGAMGVASAAASVKPILPVDISSINASSTATAINISWTNTTGASSYVVKASTTQMGSATGTATTCTSSGCSLTVGNSPIGALNTTTYFTIIASNGSNATSFSQEFSVTPIPAPVLSVTVTNSQELTVNWSVIANATDYKIYYSTTQGQALSGGVFKDCLLVTSCAIQNLTSGTTYYFALVATRSSGGNLQSTEYTGIPIQSFSLFSVLQNAVNNTTVLDVKWNTTLGATTYVIAYGTTSTSINLGNTEVTAITGSSTQTSSISLLAPGTLYYIKVTAKNANGTLAANAVFSNVTYPVAPKSLNASGVNYNSATLNWQNNYNNVNLTYVVYRSTTNNFTISSSTVQACNASSSSTSLTILSCIDNSSNSSDSSSLTENTLYYYRIVTMLNNVTINSGLATSSGSLSSAPSAVYSFTSALNPSDTITLQSINSTDTTADITWTYDVGTENLNYVVYQSTSTNPITSGKIITCGTGSTTFPSSPSTTNVCNVSGLSQNSIYYFAIVATNNAPSDSVSVTLDNISVTTQLTLIKPAFTVSISSISDTSVKLSWQFNIGNQNVNFTIMQGINPVNISQLGGDCSLSDAAPSLVTQTCTINSLTQNTKYSFQIKANTIAVSSYSYSNTVNPTTQFTAATSGLLSSISATKITDTAITLSWSFAIGGNYIGNAPVTFSVNFTGSNSPVNGCSGLSTTSPTTALSCTVTGLTQNTTYSFTISASNTAPSTLTYSPVSFTTNFNSGNNVTLQTVVSSGPQVTLTFSANYGSANIIYSITQNNTIITPSCNSSTALTTGVPPTTTVICIINGLTENSNFNYTVTATNLNNSNITSATASLITNPITAPIISSITLATTTSLTISWNSYSYGDNKNIIFNVYAALSPTIPTTSSSLFCTVTSTAVSLKTSCAGPSSGGISLTLGNTYNFIVVATNQSGDTAASTGVSLTSNSMSFLFNYPQIINSPTGNPTLTNTGGAVGTSVTYTGTLGNWNDSSNCTYQFYSNNNPITAASGTITSSSIPPTYVTTNSCQIISFSVTCKNLLSPTLSGTTVFNKPASTNVINGVDTNAIFSNYYGRVGSYVNTNWSTQFLGFLNSLLNNGIPLPDYMYAMRNTQNATSGTALYDLYCSEHNAAGVNFAFSDARGIKNPITTSPIASVSSVFTSGNPSSIVAITRTPATNSSLNGVSNYFGYNNSANSVYLNPSYINVTPNVLSCSLVAGMNDFWGVSLGSNSFNYLLNSCNTSNSSNTTLNGNWNIGKYSGTNSDGLNEYMAFAAAWTSTALTQTQLNQVKQAYYPTLGQGLQTYLYSASWDRSTLQRCVIDTVTGALGICKQMSLSGLNSPSTAIINYNTTNNSYTMYIANFVSSNIVKCPVDLTNGSIGTCTTAVSSPSITNPHGLSIFNGNAYVMGYNGPVKMYQCPLNSTTGAFGTCNSITIANNGLQGSFIYPTGSTNYLYNVTSGGIVWDCPIAANGTLSTCTRTGTTDATGTGGNYVTLSNSRSIYIINLNGTNYGYISDSTTNTVIKCTVNSSGYFTLCATAQTGFNNARGIAIYISTNGNINLYVANRSANTISVCPITASNGNIGTCSVTNGSSAGFDFPESLFIQNY
ncbi:fibronectin type III domain-containing protein [Silvanigrella aquatica]|uniref:Fibronectin type-III domain-containing protein n=1 Tax=Silvanigrella aquatica TaxID=1915309 RepID=A0A1L4D0P4_9BACT|nr:fibronectin type III domain-containing protein [Silvanigrella aquatica]APJ03783.1 hypothetical protein AXG55_07635 [Silvanigrella aquatica]